MKPEKEQLLHDLLAGDGRREATLLAATNILRRRRHWRRARQTFLLLLLLVAATTLLVETNNRRHAPVPPARPEAQLAAAPRTQELTDDQLLALFPNIPVGLATLPNGKKLLLFLQPADAAKYVTRL
jgi:hypothetical protein